MMKKLFLWIVLILPLSVEAQHLPFGTVFGSKPGHTGLVTAANLDNYMGKRTRIKATVSGRITLITKAKGGWFDVDAGHGRIITAHFKNYGINLPANLKNRYILMEGIAQKQLVADDHQHYAGGNGSRNGSKPANKQLLMFEVSGLEVRK
ncbi:MAG: DUF4920 domain-containing protein [Bacteroidota bacterium]